MAGKFRSWYMIVPTYTATSVLEMRCIFVEVRTQLQSVTFSTSRCLVAASNGGRPPSSGFMKFPLPQQQLITTEPQKFTNWLTQSLTNQLNSTDFTLITALLVISRHGPQEKYRSCWCIQLLPWKHSCSRSCYLVTAVCMIAYLAVVAQLGVYMRLYTD
jgi:hypothetical protein